MVTVALLAELSFVIAVDRPWFEVRSSFQAIDHISSTRKDESLCPPSILIPGSSFYSIMLFLTKARFKNPRMGPLDTEYLSLAVVDAGGVMATNHFTIKRRIAPLFIADADEQYRINYMKSW
jgi:hypothetical protein